MSQFRSNIELVFPVLGEDRSLAEQRQRPQSAGLAIRVHEHAIRQNVSVDAIGISGDQRGGLGRRCGINRWAGGSICGIATTAPAPTTGQH